MNIQGYNHLNTIFNKNSPAALIWQDFYDKWNGKLDFKKIEGITSNPLLLTGYEIVQTNFSSETRHNPEIILYDESKHNIIDIFNKVDEGKDNGCIVINGDPYVLGGGIYERSLYKFTECVHKQYPEYKGTYLFKIPNDIVRNVWEKCRDEIRKDLSKTIVSSEENVFLVSNCMQILEFYLNKQLYARKPTLDGMKYPGQDNVKVVRLRSPFNGTSKFTSDEFEDLANKYPIAWTPDMAGYFYNQGILRIDGVSIFADAQNNMLDEVKKCEMAYLVGVWPDVENPNFIYEDKKSQEVFLFQPFRKLINNLLRSGALCSNLYMSLPGGRFNFLRHFDKQHLHSEEFWKEYSKYENSDKNLSKSHQSSLKDEAAKIYREKLIEIIYEEASKGCAYKKIYISAPLREKEEEKSAKYTPFIKELSNKSHFEG